jgi:DNA-binding MarR family transcriptional regulator
VTFYMQWGFSDSPFQSRALPADEVGERLLVGRRQELKRIKKRILNAPKIVTVEGPNGIGKSSLVNVAAFQCFRDYHANDDGPLLIPCRKTFQLRAGQDVDEFVSQVLMEVAQTLIEQAEAISTGTLAGNRTPSIDRWLNSPQISSWQGGLGAASMGKSSETNTATGFSASGFRKAVLDWLQEIFPEPSVGGVICVIDNLELLETSSDARRQLEALRDELFTVTGFRWVLCGALGIVLGVASSPRLEGLLHSPIELGGIAKSAAVEVLESRVEVYERAPGEGYLPITSDQFRKLYVLLAENLRSTLGLADEFCQWVEENEDTVPEAPEQKERCFNQWLLERADGYRTAAEKTIKPRAWEIFEIAISKGGRFSPSDFRAFGANSGPALRPHVKDLEDAGLLTSSRDDSDQRRKTIEVTTRGHLVQFARGRTARNRG